MKRIKPFTVLCCTAVLFTACDTTNGHEYVDLGLPSGTLWATCNVGATSPEKYGNYYAWGETEPKKDYSWDTYKYGTYNYNGDYSKLTKYNGTDGRTTLEADDDAATANWGGTWRTPTNAEWEELAYKCEWKWTDNYNATTGVAGYFVIGSNGNSIFLPAAGYQYDNDNAYLNAVGEICSYWSSSLNTNYPSSAWREMVFSCRRCLWPDPFKSCNERSSGNPMRPVLKNK